MQDIALKMQNDFTFMLMGGIALAVLLVIVLVVVVSAMKVKTYKDKFLDIKSDNKEKAEYISALEGELQAFKIKNASNEQSLQQFAETKEILKTTNETLLTLQAKYNELDKELGQINARFETLQETHKTLTQDHIVFKERYDVLQEDNNRFRTNNTRLLMKLESEERQASSRVGLMNSNKKETKG